MRERLSLALLEALTAELLRQGSNVVVVYNGIEEEDARDPLDSISVIYLGDHLERLSARDHHAEEARCSAFPRNC